jgi:hypothetical protein
LAEDSNQARTKSTPSSREQARVRCSRLKEKQTVSREQHLISTTLTFFGVLRDSSVGREFAHPRRGEHGLDNPFRVVLHEHLVGKSLGFKVRVKVVRDQPVVAVFGDGVEEGVVVAIAKHARSYGLDRVGTGLGSLRNRSGIVLVLVSDFIDVVGKVSKQEALFFANFFGNFNCEVKAPSACMCTSIPEDPPLAPSTVPKSNAPETASFMLPVPLASVLKRPHAVSFYCYHPRDGLTQQWRSGPRHRLRAINVCYQGGVLQTITEHELTMSSSAMETL